MTQYFIPDDFDKTPTQEEPLDHYVVDEDIGKIIKRIYNEPASGLWIDYVTENGDDAPAYFSPPFMESSRVVPAMFGFTE